MNPLIITISRQYGSGGREIGEKLGEALGIPVYDYELITHAAEDGNISVRTATETNETATKSLLYTLAMGSGAFSMGQHGAYSMNLNDRLFVLQSNLIRRLADEGSCIFIGRCADYVLRERSRVFKVFIYGGSEERIARVMARHSISRAEATERITKTDRRRSSYYNFYTGKKWGRFEDYDLMINSSHLGIDATAAVLAECAHRFDETTQAE